MKPTIYLALTDDWELRGDGSGDIERIQFHPMRELVRLFNKYGVRATFNAEIMQQLAFRKFQERHPELKILADRWDEHVVDTFKQGHDIQLHIHSQWSDARYEAGKWRLSGDWSILNYDAYVARAMIVAGREYLENLLRPEDPAYRCVAFRAGALCLAPSPHMLNLLIDEGILLDTSIVGGLRVDTRNVQLDYTNCEESFLPFYPRMDDARKLSDKREKIICAPIYHFYGSRHQSLKQVLSIGWRKAMQRLRPLRPQENEMATGDYAQQEWADLRNASTVARIFDKAVKPCVIGKHLTSDLGKLNGAFLREMLQAFRKQAADAGLVQVPVILTNHSKYIEDYAPIERFLIETSNASDIKFVTLAELAAKLQAAEFEIKTATS